MTQNFRATHRVDTPGHPPLYCLREEDAVRVAQIRHASDGSESLICILTGDIWAPWRAYP